MKTLILSIILLSSLFGARVVETRWLKGQSFSGYLADRNASIGLIRNLDEDDRKFLSDIEGGVKFYELFDGEGVLLQALIPLGEEMQIQIVREGAGGHYSFDIVPSNYVEREHKVVIPVKVNPHTDISRATNTRRLADKE
jgi:hypothetical protein